MTNISIEELIIPSSVTFLNLLNMRTLKTIHFFDQNDTNQLQSIEIKRCQMLQSLQFPSSLTNLIIIDSPNCFPLNVSELHSLPFGQQSYFSTHSSTCDYILP